MKWTPEELMVDVDLEFELLVLIYENMEEPTKSLRFIKKDQYYNFIYQNNILLLNLYNFY